MSDARVKVPLAVQYVDHNTLAVDYKSPDDHRFLEAFCAKHGLYFSRPGNGICHYLHIERFARPGQLLIGADSHTPMSGALGMIAIGASGLEAAAILAGAAFELEMPRVVGVELRDRLPPWVEAKDIALELLRRRGLSGGLGRIFEFTGPGVATLNITDRATICNMIAELGATTALFPSDERTREWLASQQRAEQWLPLVAEPSASYDEHELIDLSRLVPLVAKPGSPGHVCEVREVAGTPVAQVCVGSCVNSGYRDLAIVARVLKDRTLPSGLSLTVTPGSRQVLDQITESGVYHDLVNVGARMLEPACGPCVGMGHAPPTDAVSVRTFNRNFPGRSGTPSDRVYLCSPATAAATAAFGVITDPRDLGSYPELPEPAGHPSVDDRQIVPPLPEPERVRVSVPRGPNIVRLAAQTPLPSALEANVVIVVGDDISTGDLAPDGTENMACRSNVPAMARLVFRHVDPEFATRAEAAAPGLIVAGHNYGHGSSSEHAALAPKFLGVCIVVAKSFARIYRRSLIAQGIVPLIFADESDYARATRGQVWRFPDLRYAIEGGDEECCASLPGAIDLQLMAAFSERERTVLLAGGLIAQLRRDGSGFGVTLGHSGAVDQGAPCTDPIPQPVFPAR